MRRTNLVLDVDLRETATRVLGVKTYSAAVNIARAETLRLKKIESLPQFFGKALWRGELSVMREDRPHARPRKKAAGHGGKQR